MSLHIDKPLVVSSQDRYWLRFVDVYVNQQTDKEVATGIDLDSYQTIEIMFAFDTGSGYGSWTTKAMTKHADQATYAGYAYYDWATDDLSAGDMKIRGKLTESGGDVHYSDLIYEEVEAL